VIGSNCLLPAEGARAQPSSSWNPSPSTDSGPPPERRDLSGPGKGAPVLGACAGAAEGGRRSGRHRGRAPAAPRNAEAEAEALVSSSQIACAQMRGPIGLSKMPQVHGEGLRRRRLLGGIRIACAQMRGPIGLSKMPQVHGEGMRQRHL